MADLPGDFWSGWIIVLTLVSVSVIGWLIWSIYFSPSPHLPEENENEPVWDEDLMEGSAPAPMWWFWLILGSTIFSVCYLMLYPGLGSFSGALNWSQDARIRNSHENFIAEFNEVRTQIASMDYETLQDDAGMMETAERIFQRECAACHGRDAKGQLSLFPDLTDNDWQWGGGSDQIEQTLRNGRQANMIAWAGTLQPELIEQVADYVITMGSSVEENHPGQATYNTYCVACHGMDGSGNPLLGAPSLSDDIWLYGNERDSVLQSITDGRKGMMPSFGDRLDDTQIRLLVAWLTRGTSDD